MGKLEFAMKLAIVKTHPKVSFQSDGALAKLSALSMAPSHACRRTPVSLSSFAVLFAILPVSLVFAAVGPEEGALTMRRFPARPTGVFFAHNIAAIIFYDVQLQDAMAGLGMAENSELVLSINRLKSLQKLYLFEQKGGENYLG